MATELKDIDSYELIKELRGRGYTTDLLFCLEDVDRQLENVRFFYVQPKRRDASRADKYDLDEYDKQEILDNLNFEYYIEQINKEIFDKVLIELGFT